MSAPTVPAPSLPVTDQHRPSQLALALLENGLDHLVADYLRSRLGGASRRRPLAFPRPAESFASRCPLEGTSIDERKA